MTGDGFTFINSSIIGSTAIQGYQFPGGRAALAISASQFGTSVALQHQIGGVWVPMCSSIVSSQVFSFDGPPGQYRLVSAGSSVAMYASMNRIPY